MEEKLPDGLDMGPVNFRRKFRWVAKLFKDAKQVNKAEFVKVSRRPPLTISATATKSLNEGGEMSLIFSRTNIEPCDEIWLGLFDGAGRIIEEWELCEVKKLPFHLYTSHIPGDEEYEDAEGEETLKFCFGHMRYRRNINLVTGKFITGKWTNWSTIKT